MHQSESEKSNTEINVARTSDTQLLQQIDAKFTSQRKEINMELLQLIDDKFAEQRESLGREYRECEAHFVNTLQAKFDAWCTASRRGKFEHPFQSPLFLTTPDP